jgi:hypothetical protein
MDEQRPPSDQPEADDPRDRGTQQREAALDAREVDIRAREQAIAERVEETRAIMDAAAERDGQADARDSQADDRDQAASLESFLHDEDFSTGVKARRAAGMDRSDSKGDRASAADDRVRLSSDGSPSTPEAGREDGEGAQG